ncbi:MAG: class A sortase [Lactobacillales bacterium]|jgi:sortase A|nr:class A sortase [Lactobacillales bacterium]
MTKISPNVKKRKKSTVILIILGILVGLALIFNKQIRYFLIWWNSDRYYHELSVKKLFNNNKLKQSFDFDAVQPISTEEILKFQLINQKLPVIGFISMPKVQMKLPIFKGLSNTALSYGAGTMKENQTMGKGNYALASHRVDNPNLLFSPIQWAEKGMLIYITNLDKIYTYKTTKVKRVTPDHAEVIDDVPNKKLITLVTCNDPGAIKRVIVHGKLVETYKFKKAPELTLNAFKIDINQVDWSNNPYGK